MAKCVGCGTELSTSARFCSVCGLPIAGGDDAATIDWPDPTSPPPYRPPSPSSSRPSSSVEYLLNEGRFLPGRLIAGRYRIIALLGKGGMGEVYRADDLTLGQAVAMKFLPDAATQDPGLLERFRNEVRTARRVSHPNVCRVYDVGEVEGQTFFTMEYVDGEDLASLLRRIGRLPQDKAVEIARQLCAGLAAAHAKGVLHRDLKPANIMLDGRGQAVIMDFGLAGIADDIRGLEVRSGTPAYMSPEQIAGTEVTMRSDIYALGLVLYEVFTGKRAFAEKTAGVLHGHGDRTPSRPSSVVKDLDPIVEKVILRCLEESPSARPANVLSVAAALPGGDPLAAALAAGETPSPQMVAAAGETAGLRPPIAVVCLAAVLAGLAVGVYLIIRYSAVQKMHLEMSPEVLAEKSRELISRVGYTEKPADTASGFDFDTNLRTYVDREANQANWNQLLTGRPSLLYFWYRQSPDLMVAHDFRDPMLTPDIVAEDDPRTTLSGMVNLKLDPKGRLISFQAIPPQKFEVVASTAPVDWAPLFAAAELDPSRLLPAPPQWNSLAASDTRAAWTGVWPGTTRPLHVEAAAWQGKPVYFALIGDWNEPWRMVSTSKSEADKRRRTSGSFGLAMLIALLVAGAVLARRNYRQGRGDRDGALRLAGLMFVLGILLWLCRAHFVAGLETFLSTMLAIASSLLVASVVWAIYMAVEPWIRRRWPQALISWTRLISGQVRDPLVGRDILFGVTFGALWLIIEAATYPPLAQMGASPPLSGGEYLMGGRFALGRWLLMVPSSIFGTLQFFFLLLGLKVLVEGLFRLVKLKVAASDWIAAIFFVGILTAIQGVASTHRAVEVPALILVYAVLVMVVLRFGLVPLAVGVFTTDMLSSVPFTSDFSEWYASTTLLALLSVVAVAAWGFYHSLGGEPVWKVEAD